MNYRFSDLSITVFPPQELIYARLSGVRFDVLRSSAGYQLFAAVHEIQADNQLLHGAEKWHFVYARKISDEDSNSSSNNRFFI